MKVNPLHAIWLLGILCFGSFAVYTQQNERAAATQVFQSGDYSKAAELFKKLVKTNDKDAEVWYYLGTAYFHLDKFKDAIKSLQKAVDLEQKNDRYHTNLAYTYLVTRDDRAYKTAAETLEINPLRAEAHYILGVISYRDESYANAYNRAKRAIEINPKYAAPYRLKSQALVASFLALSGKVLPPASRSDLLLEAVSDLEKYLALVTDTRKEIESELENLRYFAKYYSLPENRIARDVTITEPPDPTTTALKIISNPRPEYTNHARGKGISGTLRLLVAFDASGKIGPILVIKSLDDGLDLEAIRAARSISFKPSTKKGLPVSTVKTLEYTFSIY